MAQPGYRLVFETTAHAADPTIWWIGVAGALLALVVIALGVRIWRGYRGTVSRAGRWTWFVTLFIAIWAAAFLFGSVHQSGRERALHTAIAAGQVRTIAGCLDRYAPEPPTRPVGTATANERWSVAGVQFRYASGDMGTAFKQSARDDGPVRADSRVRVRYIFDPASGDNRILRLEVADRACPAAPGYDD